MAKHKFRLTRLSEEEQKWQSVDIEIGESYQCIGTYTGWSDQRNPGHDSVFTKGEWYILVSYNESEATFIQNGGGRFWIRSFMEGALFNHFSFDETYSEYITRTREERLSKILKDER